MLIEDQDQPKLTMLADLSVKATRLSFLLLIASLGWMQPGIQVSSVQLTPTDMIFPFVAVLWMLTLILGGVKLRWGTLHWLLLLYFGTLAISSIFSADPARSYIKLAGEAYLLVLAAITISLIDNETRLKHLSYAWFAGASVSIAIGLATIFVFYAAPGNWLLDHTTYHYGAVPVGNFPRLSSVFVSASMFCNYLNVSAVLLLMARKLEWLNSSTFTAAFVLVLICSAFTVSIGLGGLFLAIGIWIWSVSTTPNVSIRRISLILGAGLAVALLIPAFVALEPYASAPYKTVVTGTGLTLYPSPRLLVWTETLKTFAADPLTGIGLNMPTSSVVFTNTEGTISVLTDAHNIFLSVAAQNGIFALAVIVGLCFFLLRTGLSRTRPSMITNGLTIAFLTAFVYQGLTGAFEDARHLWVLIGLIPASLQFRSRPQ